MTSNGTSNGTSMNLCEARQTPMAHDEGYHGEHDHERTADRQRLESIASQALHLERQRSHRRQRQQKLKTQHSYSRAFSLHS